MPVSAHFSGRTEVRWGIIGCGDVTEVKSGPGFQKAAGSSLVAVMRRKGALAADYARRHGVARWYDSAAALVADSAVDAVYIATPPETHADYALLVAAAGKPAYVEKPMARHLPECARMVRAFGEANLPLFVAYYRRRLPRFLEVAAMLRGGVLGRVTGISYRQAAPFHRGPAIWRVDAAQAGAGHFLDVGSHTLDLLDALFGPLTDVAGLAANRGSDYAVEDTVAMSFQTAAGVPGVASWNFASAVAHDALTITGTAGQLVFSIFGNDAICWETAEGVKLLERPNPPHVAQPLIQAVVDDLLGRGVCPSTGESASRTTRVMDTVLEAYYGGRSRAFWLDPTEWPGRRTAAL